MTRVEYGDWQTPLPLAREVVAGLAERMRQRGAAAPKTVLEPSCGRGAFLVAASERWPAARLVGREINPRHVADAKAALPEADIVEADFFSTSWPKTLAALDDPVLVLGNPPWVTSAALGTLDASNRPPKTSLAEHTGLDALTGASNFDVSEWLIRHLLEALAGSPFALAMLVKSSVARRLVQHIGAQGAPIAGGLRAIDAKKHFDAAVDATLLTMWTDPRADGTRWPVFESLRADEPARTLGLVQGTLTSNIEAFKRTQRCAGHTPAWRSGLKHDCARVMELRPGKNGWTSAAGGEVSLETEFVYPLLKGSDIANGRMNPRRAVIVPQMELGQPTTPIQERAPETWAYLTRHRAALQARKSRIYRNRPAFSVFGVGPYTFAPYKVAIAGLYSRLRFELVCPLDGRPVMLDDTCYFLPFDTHEEASSALHVLRSPTATEFFEARVFWDAKRPITKALLAGLDLSCVSELS